jgi:hypothetical protein
VRRSEDGQVGGLEALVFGLLLFVIGGLVLADAWGIIDAKMAAEGAAREAARSVVQAPPGSDVQVVATRAAADALREQRRDPARMTVSVEGSVVRCHPVTTEVRYRAPMLELPIVGAIGSSFVVSASQELLVDPFRSGVEGTARCGNG